MLTKIWTTAIVLSVAASLVAWVCVAAHARGIRPLRAIARFAQKLSLAGVVVFGLMAAPLYRAGSTKVGGGTNNVPPNLNQPLPQMQQGGILSRTGFTGLTGFVGEGNLVNLVNPVQDPITSTNTTRTLTAEDFVRGFVMARVGTGEDFDFTPPQNAVIVADWHAFGAAKDWIYVAMTNWMFKVGTNNVERLRIYSFGKIEPLIREVNGSIATNNWLAPFMASLGVVPEANWHLLGNGEPGTGNGLESQVWYCITPDNTLVVTWQNALLGRDTGKPISFQVEFFTDGRFVFRYDLSRLDGETAVNFLAGASFGGNEWTTNSIPTNVTSMAFCPLSEADAYDQDPDRDGLLTIDELFFYHTDPHNADSDYDGLADGEELLIYNSDPLDPNSISAAYCDGLAAKLGDLDPFSCPEGSTNTVLEHVFYSGTTNGVFAYPTSTVDTAVLKIMVSGEGMGRLVVGDVVVPLVGGCQTGLTRFTGLRSGNNPDNPVNPVTNILLLAVGKGVSKEFWFDKPDGLDLALRSGDLLIGRMPTFYWPHGWLAFPHTEATAPCIHDFVSNGKTVSLVHGEELPGLTATWTNGNADVEIENLPPDSAEIHGHFARNQTRPISYTVDHPSRLNEEPVAFAQTLRFCPNLADGDAPPGAEDEDFDSSEWPMQSGMPEVEDTTSEYEAAAEYARIAGLPLAQGVLQLYGAIDREAMVSLTVPTGAPVRCCDCPDHWQSNYVAAAWMSPRILVYDAEGNNFDIAYEDVMVSVRGEYPSREPYGDGALFVTNGAPSFTKAYTILGVDIENLYGPSLSEYASLNASFGFPITVNTNLDNAVSLRVITDVLLTNGVFRLALENCVGAFEMWAPERTYFDYSGGGPELVTIPAEKLLDSADSSVRYFTVRQWRQVVSRHAGGGRDLDVLLLSSATGHCDFAFSYVFDNGGSAIRSSVSRRISSVMPPLLPDYDRNGRIDSEDILHHMRRSMFRYWINECKIAGDVWEEMSLFEGVADAIVGLENWRNDHVDGRYDLINLFPVAVCAEPFLDAWSGDVKIKVRCIDGNDVIRFTLANVGHVDAGSIRTAPRFNVAGQPLHSATMNWLTNSLALSKSQYAAAFARDSALLVCEAAKPTWYGLQLTVEVDGVAMHTFRLPMRMSVVDDMYRFVSIRDSYENEMFTFTGTNAPPNNPDSGLADKDVFFVHGFNVSPENARNWNREMFKRFWVSGMNARYWGVTWSGDYHVLFEDFNGLHYHRDVRQALMTAPTFRNLVNSNGVDSVVIGHSLGNMVVSEALLKGANASTYIMLDAAVASESYRPELQADSSEIVDKYVPSDWDGYHERTWSANWYTWFTNTPNDARAKIGWAGHFAPLLNRQGLDVFNFYSSGDEVFAENSETPGVVTGVFHWPTLNLDWPFFHPNLELDAYPWQKQEVFKGVNAAGSLSAGWGFHCWTTNIDNQSVIVRYSAAGANAMVADGSIVTNAVFDRGVSAMFSSTISDYDIADILAFHIPAVSSPAGRVMTAGEEMQDGLDFDLNGSSYRANGWGRPRPSGHPDNEPIPWLHSDIKNMAYYYVYPAFTNIVNKGEL